MRESEWQQRLDLMQAEHDRLMAERTTTINDLRAALEDLCDPARLPHRPVAPSGRMAAHVRPSARRAARSTALMLEHEIKYTTRTYRVRLTFSHDAPLPDDGALMIELEKLLAGETLSIVPGSRAYIVIDEVEIDDHA